MEASTMAEFFKNDTVATATNLGTLAFPQDLPNNVIAKTNIRETDDVFSLISVSGVDPNELPNSNDLNDYYVFSPYNLKEIRVTFSASTTGDYANFLSVVPVQGVARVEGDLVSMWTGGVLGSSVYASAFLAQLNSIETQSASAGGFQFLGNGVTINDFPNSSATWVLTGEPVVFVVNGVEARGTEDQIINNPKGTISEVSYLLELFPALGLPKTDSSVDISSISGSDLDRGDGFDIVTIAGRKADHSISSINMATNSITIDGKMIENVERLQFSDGTLALDDEGVAGQAYRIYKAAFARTPDNDGLKFWINEMDGATALFQVSTGFVNSAEFKSVYGNNPTGSEIVGRLYQNVLGRDGESAGFSYWVGEIDSGRQSIAQVLMGFSESPENVTGVAPLISDGIFFA
jgi:hypothetical protein